MLMKTYYWK